MDWVGHGRTTFCRTGQVADHDDITSVVVKISPLEGQGKVVSHCVPISGEERK